VRVKGKDFRTVWIEGPNEKPLIRMIDQRRLPFEFVIHNTRNVGETCLAIKDMTVRGAGAIGVTAAFGMAQGVLEKDPEEAKKAIEATRPTAQNLFYAVNRVYEVASHSANSVNDARKEAEAVAEEDVESCKKIGEYGAELLKDSAHVLTHCNAGWLAFVDWGSALSPIYVAHREGKKIKVYVDDTQPREQGGKLTAWELQNEGVDYVISPDTAVAHLLEHGEVDIIIVGSDRIAANGDVANKIGTQVVARIARDFGVPFYVAAPTSTIDLNCSDGAHIPIEFRSEDEVLYKTGRTADGRIEKVLVVAPGSHAYNPSFDVTPASLIKGIITQKGIIKPNAEEIRRVKQVF